MTMQFRHTPLVHIVSMLFLELALWAPLCLTDYDHVNVPLWRASLLSKDGMLLLSICASVMIVFHACLLLKYQILVRGPELTICGPETMAGLRLAAAVECAWVLFVPVSVFFWESMYTHHELLLEACGVGMGFGLLGLYSAIARGRRRSFDLRQIHLTADEYGLSINGQRYLSGGGWNPELIRIVLSDGDHGP